MLSHPALRYNPGPCPCSKYLDDNARDDWSNKYIDYKSLKDLIKAAANELEEGSSVAFSPRMTSLSVQRKPDLTSADERFNMLLEKEVRCSGAYLHLFKQAGNIMRLSSSCQLPGQAGGDAPLSGSRAAPHVHEHMWSWRLCKHTEEGTCRGLRRHTCELCEDGTVYSAGHL